MKTTEIKNVPIAPNPHGVDVRKFYDSGKVLATHITLQPGEQIKKHSAPVDVFFYVLEGTGTIEMGDESQEVKSDTIIESKAGAEHCWYNKSSEKLRIMAVKMA